jgi:hypothetical protein
VAGFPGRSVRFGDPQPVDPGRSAALPKELAARKTAGFHREVNDTHSTHWVGSRLRPFKVKRRGLS